MSIFASRTQATIQIPFDEPHTVTIQKLSGRHLELAKEVHQSAALDTLKRIDLAGLQRELSAIGDSTAVAERVAKAQAADPLTTYDRLVVLQKGIVAWDYAEAVTPEAIDDLSEEAAAFLARAILDLTLPAPGEAGRKNGPGPSSVA